MIAALFVLAARDYAALAAALQDDATAAKYRAAADAMAAAVEAHGWDGEWFLRAYDHAGRAVGSRRQRRGPDLPRAAGALRDGRHRRRVAGSSTARCRASSERLACPYRRAAARPAVPQLPRRARRDLDLPAGLQGKRLGVLPHQSRGSSSPRRCAAAPTARCSTCAPSRRRTRPIRPRAAPSPTSTRRWSPGPAAATPGRGQEFLADGHGVLVPRRRDAVHPRPARDARRASSSIPAFPRTGRPSACAACSAARRYEIEVANPRGSGRGVRSLTVDGKAVVRQRHPAGGTGHDGPGDGRARLIA